jgi:two-component system, NarL family, capsular synthesis sensor histidine kinase RcsC
MSFLLMSNSNVPVLRILIVEDRLASRRLLGKQCNRLGFHTCLAKNACEALELFYQIGFDLVFIDLAIQKIDGYMLARMLREHGEDLAMVAVATSVTKSRQRLCRDAGFSEVIVRPISLSGVEAITRRRITVMGSRERPILKTMQVTQLSCEILIELAQTTESAFSRIHTASSAKRNDLVLQELHAVKGVFAMQNESVIVNACKELEYAYKHKVPDSFFVQLDFLQLLIRNKLGEMLACVEKGIQRRTDS